MLGMLASNKDGQLIGPLTFHSITGIFTKHDLTSIAHFVFLKTLRDANCPNKFYVLDTSDVQRLFCQTGMAPDFRVIAD